MAQSKSSQRWLKEHFSDVYVKKAKQEGWRSRAAYKLLEIQKKRPILKQGMVVVDLGAAPGGWSQVARSLVGSKGQVIATDILPMEGIIDVEFIQGDFTEAQVLEQILSVVNGRGVDVVLSDMAPNMSGTRSVDQPKSLYLIELAVDLARKVLKPHGILLTKVFYGEGFDELVRTLRTQFSEIRIYKPDASRSRSSECYLLAKL